MHVVVGVPNTCMVTPKLMKQEQYLTPVLSMQELVRVIDTTHGLRSTALWLLLMGHNSTQAAPALLHVLAPTSHKPKVIN